VLKKMSLSNEILYRIQESRKLNPNAPKKIIYFVGPSACGKTTKVKTLEKTFGGYYQYITLDGYSSILDHQANSFFRNLNDLLTISERLVKAIQTATKTHQNTIFVDGHPILSVLKCEAVNRIYNGRIITEKQLRIIYDTYKEIVDYINNNNIFKDFQQTIYYINISLEENLRFLQKREGSSEISEEMKTELVILRRTIHSSICKINTQFKNTKVIEVNKIQGLEIIHMYLLGFSGC
jgi:ABC-type multidrug transport system ATPase subunit